MRPRDQGRQTWALVRVPGQIRIKTVNSRYSDTVIQRPVNTQTLSYGDWDKEAWQDYAHSGLWAWGREVYF